MRPIYDLLDEDECLKVKEVYKRRFLEDNYVCYNQLLKFSSGNLQNDQQSPYLCGLEYVTPKVSLNQETHIQDGKERVYFGGLRL